MSVNRSADVSALATLPGTSWAEAFMRVPGAGIEMLTDIHESGGRAAAIVSNMLAFSRPTSVGMLKHVMDELIGQAIGLVRSDFALKALTDPARIDIVTEFAPNLPPVTCHSSEVTQVLLNLLKNAVQALENVPSPRIVVRTCLEEQCIRIEVEDNGTGMSEAVRQRAFEPFFTTKSPGQGTGLGLFVSYFIVTKHHGGTLTAESSPVGTCFTITLPLNPPAVTAAAPSPSASTQADRGGD